MTDRAAYQPESDDLCLLKDVKEYVFRGGGTPTKNDDNLLQRLITAISEFLRKEASTVFDSQEHTETRSGKGGKGRILYFKFRPCTAVSSLYIDGVLIPLSMAQSDPTKYGYVGYVWDENHISLTGYYFTEGIDNIKVTYTAGYSSLPEDLKQACIETIARRYRELDRLGTKSKVLAGESVTYDLSDLDDFAQRTINRYKRVIPIL